MHDDIGKRAARTTWPRTLLLLRSILSKESKCVLGTSVGMAIARATQKTPDESDEVYSLIDIMRYVLVVLYCGRSDLCDDVM